jgi:hypothetical protein
LSQNSQRDAIGTRLSLQVNGRQLHHQLFAGDGYMCSNQRKISIGVGSQESVENIMVTWPSGLVEQLDAVPTGVDMILIEGEGTPFILREH